MIDAPIDGLQKFWYLNLVNRVYCKIYIDLHFRLLGAADLGSADANGIEQQPGVVAAARPLVVVELAPAWLTPLGPAGWGEAHGSEQQTRRFLKRKQQTAPQHRQSRKRLKPPTMPACWTGPRFWKASRGPMSAKVILLCSVSNAA